MAVLAQRAKQIILDTLGADQLSSRSSIYEIANGAIRWIENARQWSFLQRGQTVLSIIKDQPWIELPPDVRDITGYNATRSFVNSLSFTSQDNIIRLRTSRTLASNLHLSAAEEWIPGGVSRNKGENFASAFAELPADRVNLLSRTEDFTDTTWTSGPGADVVQVLTANVDQNPLNARVDADRLHVNATGGNVKSVFQEVDYPLLLDGDYTFSIYLKKDTSIAHTSDKTLVRIQVAGGTTQTTGVVDWSASPPTFVLSSSAGTGTHTVAVDQLSNGWNRLSVTLTHDIQEFQGRLRCAVFPVDLSTETGSVFAWGAQLERTLKTKYADIISATSVAATPYVPVRGSAPANGGPPRPVLMVWPIPQTTELGKLSITYRAQVPRLGDDSDEISMPDYMTDLFFECLRIYARGFEEEDEGMLHQRIESLKDSDFFWDVVDRDGDLFPDIGEMEGGHVYTARQWINWDTGRSVSLP